MEDNPPKRSLKLEDTDTDTKRPRLEPPHCPVGYNGQPVQEYTPGDPYLYENCEIFPRSSAYHPNNEKIRILNEQAILILHNQLIGSRELDVEIARLTDRVYGQRHIKFTARIDVSFDGDTGSGKSTLINSLLSQTNLASEGNGSKSCTQVAAEFVDNTNMKENYEAQIFLHPIELIQGRVAVHVENYQNYEQQKSDFPLEEIDDGLAEEATTAMEWCQTLFLGRPECLNKQAMHDILTSDSASEVVQTLTLWILDIRSKLNMEKGSNKLTIRASKPNDFRKNTSRFTERTDPDGETESMLWPIVASCRFLVDSPFLRQGIKLADLPGRSDINVDRRNASLTYQRDRCNAIIVVSTLRRAETLPSLQRSLKRAIRLKGVENVILALTHIENCTEDPDDLTEKERHCLSTLQEAASTTQEAVKQARACKAPPKETMGLKDSAKKAAMGLKRARILIRNGHIAHNFQEQYKDITGERQRLRVVFASNSIHQQYMQGYYPDEDPPCLRVEEDGIRDLRHAVLRMLDNGKTKDLLGHVRRVRGIITDIQIWVQKSRNDRKDIVSAMVEKTLAQYVYNVPQHETSLCNAFRAEIVRTFLARLGDSWGTDIRRLIDKWAMSFPVGTLKAFCRRNGVHKPKDSEQMSMTEEFLGVVEKDMDNLEVWMKAHVDEKCDEAVVNIGEVLYMIEKGFENESNSAGIDMATLIRRLQLRKESLHQHAIEESIKLKAELHNIMMRAQSEAPLEENTHSAFVRDLHIVYQQLAIIKGKGCGKVIIEQMKDRVTGVNGPFSKMATALTLATRSAIEAWSENCQQYLSRGLRNVLLDVEDRFTGPEMPEAQREKLRASLELILPQIEDVYENQIPALIEGCKEWA